MEKQMETTTHVRIVFSNMTGSTKLTMRMILNAKLTYAGLHHNSNCESLYIELHVLIDIGDSVCQT